MKRYGAEFLGTFVLVFAGCGAAVLAGDKIGFLGISLAFGLALLAMVYVVGPVSGCHINPAVTLGVALSKRMDPKHVAGYMISQVLGGIVASAILLAIAKGAAGGYDPSSAGFAANGYGAHSPGGYGLAAAFLTEIVLTAVLVFTVLGATDISSPAGFAGIPIGLALALTNLVAIPVTNASINPARSIGPAIFAGGWALGQLWLFIVAPLIGAALAAGAYAAVRRPEVLISTREAEKALDSDRIQRDRDRRRAVGEG